MRKALAIGIIFCLGIILSAEVTLQPNSNTSWVETFKEPSDLKAWKSKGKLEVVNNALTFSQIKKDTTFNRYIKWDPKYPYLQIDFEKVVPFKKYSYRGMTVLIAGGKTKSVFSTAGGWQTGIMTINLLDTFPELSDGNLKGFSMIIYIYGGTASIKSFKMISKPENVIYATAVDNKKELYPGDKINIKVKLQEPAKDVTVTVKQSYCFAKVKLNQAGYIQLTSEDQGKTWTGEVTIPKNVAKKDIAQGKWIFDAKILGGKVKKIVTVNPWKVKSKSKE